MVARPRRRATVSTEGFGAGGALQRETTARVLAAHLVQTVRPVADDVVALDDARPRRAVQHIRAPLADDPSLDGTTALAAISASHFARSFRRVTGVSPLRIVVAGRLAAAPVLLRTTRLPVAEIAHRWAMATCHASVSTSVAASAPRPGPVGAADRGLSDRMIGLVQREIGIAPARAGRGGHLSLIDRTSRPDPAPQHNETTSSRPRPPPP
jgi:AraC-like DNA-binding protein